MPASLSDIQHVSAGVSAKDGAGVPVSLDSGVVPVWSSDNPAVFTVDASSDPTGMTAVVTAVSAGTGNLNVSALLGDGSTISGSDSVTVTLSGPASLVISFGTPA